MERVLLDLHSGRIFGLVGKLVDALNVEIDKDLQTEIARLEETVKTYQSESKYIEAIGVLEELLKIKK